MSVNLTNDSPTDHEQEVLTTEFKVNLLNAFAFGGFILYAIGIYLHVAIMHERWGNVAVDLALNLLGPLGGVILVVAIGGVILLTSRLLKFFRLTNIFLCWFWIPSLYQCAVNSFLQFFQLPDEPINLFFKIFFPTAWYPVKEVVFTSIALSLTFIWGIKVFDGSYQKVDVIFLSALAVVFIVATLASQFLLINPSL
ncbi:MAG: hypothetical protein ACTSRW_11705 [Candidatus Helarchaeota archaeon]